MGIKHLKVRLKYLYNLCLFVFFFLIRVTFSCVVTENKKKINIYGSNLLEKSNQYVGSKAFSIINFIVRTYSKQQTDF